MRRIALYILLLMMFFMGCTEEGKLIEGTISGRVEIYSQLRKQQPFEKDIRIYLQQDTELFDSTLTSIDGRYFFRNVPYGKYSLFSYKPGFVPPFGTVKVIHIGGDCPTFQDLSLSEVPTYSITIDSIGYCSDDYFLILYLSGDSLVTNTSFRAFAGKDQNLSKDYYASVAKGHLYNYFPYPTIVPVFGKIWTWDFDTVIGKLKNDTIFLRIYPEAMYQGYGTMEFYPEALGKPSNVIKFLWNDLVQK